MPRSLVDRISALSLICAAEQLSIFFLIALIFGTSIRIRSKTKVDYRVRILTNISFYLPSLVTSW